MNSNSVTTLSNFLLTNSLISSGNSQLSQLAQQLSSGQNESSLVGYGNQAQTVLNLQSGQQTVQNYVQSNTMLSTYMGAYNATLTQLQTDATTLQGALTNFNINDPTTVANLNNVLTGVITDISATLNSQVNNRYIYGGTGSRLTTAPVVDDILSQFKAQASAAAPAGLPATAPSIDSTTGGFIAAQPGSATATPFTGTLPSYDTNYTPSMTTTTAPPEPQSPQPIPPATTLSAAQIASVNDSYGTQTATVADNRQETFGFSSNDPTIQALIYSAQSAYYAVYSAQQAQTNPAPANADQLIANANTYVGNAESAVNTALTGGTDAAGTTVSGLQNMLGQTGNVQSALKDISDLNTQTLAQLTTQTSSLEAVDTAKVAEEISALENQLNASYKVTSSVMNMSILNYL